MNKNKDRTLHKYKGPNVFVRLGGYLFRFAGLTILSMMLAAASNFFSLIGPSLSANAIDAIGFDPKTLTASVDFPTVFRFCGYMAIFYLASAVLSYLLSVVIIHLNKKITQALRKEAFDRILTLPVGYFDKLQAGDVISRLSYDINVINNSLSGDLVQIISTVITVSVCFFWMLLISWQMLLVFLITLPLSVGYTIYKSKKVRPIFRQRSAQAGLLNGYTEEMLSGVKTIRAYGREEPFSQSYAQHNGIASEAYYRAEYEGAAMGPSVNFINNLSMSFISIAGACFYVTGALSLGSISSFILYGRRFSGPINEFSNILANLQSLRSAAERVFTLIDELPEQADAPDAISLTQVRGDIEFRHVKFSYDPSREIIHDLSLKVPAGKTVAIVGPTGGGKTTIVNLLMRFYDPTSGQIFLDGIPLDRIRRDDLRRAWTMVLQ